MDGAGQGWTRFDTGRDTAGKPGCRPRRAGIGLPTGARLAAMNTAKKICESDEQGVVHVEVPIGRPGQRVEVVVVWEDVGEAAAGPVDDETETGMADLVGLIEPGDLERQPQGEYEKRDPIA